jgi:TPR repeat protein
LRAARKGHGLSQYMYALKLRNEPDFEERMIWMTLSAAQGFSLAQGYLGVQFRKFSVREKCIFQEHMFLYRALYWLKKASLQGEKEPQKHYVSVLLDVKRKTLGAVDVVGHSAIPEALFWCEFMTDEMKSRFVIMWRRKWMQAAQIESTR